MRRFLPFGVSLDNPSLVNVCERLKELLACLTFSSANPDHLSSPFLPSF
jgi:hypothetical protein